jgi:GNAT superfamily N-acetyltransferase
MATHHGALIRPARLEDGGALLGLVEALADYEQLERPDAAARDRLLKDIFGPHPRLRALVAEVDGRLVGYAFTCETYSSFLALPTLYLEDIFVLQEYRGCGIGLALFRAVVAEAQRGPYGRLDWEVLDWNQPAIGFYRRLGARHMKEWLKFRLTREDFARVLQEEL